MIYGKTPATFLVAVCAGHPESYILLLTAIGATIVRLLPENPDQQFVYASALALQLLFLLTKRPLFVILSMGILVVALIAPRMLRRIRIAWMSVAEGITGILVRILLAAVFCLVVLPMGLFRRYVLRRDDLRMNEWGTGPETVFSRRAGRIAREDLECPY